MFSPSVGVICSDEYWEILKDTLSEQAPREFTSSFGEHSSRTVSLQIHFIHYTDIPTDLNVNDSPYILIYCFSCATKQDYLTYYQSKLKSWQKSYDATIYTIPLFINEQRPGKNKNGIFAANALNTFLLTDMKTMYSLQLKSDDPPKKDINKVFQAVINGLGTTIIARLSLFQNRVLQKPSVQVARAFISLINVYSRIGNSEALFKTIESAITIVLHNLSIFQSVVTPESLLLPLEFNLDLSLHESRIFKEGQVAYEFLLSYFKQGLAAKFVDRDAIGAIKFGWNFFFQIKDLIAKYAPDQYLHWKIAFLITLHNASQIEWINQNHDIFQMYSQNIEWLLYLLVGPSPSDFAALKDDENLTVPKHLQNSIFPLISRITNSPNSYKEFVIEMLQTLHSMYKQNSFLCHDSITLLKLSELNSESVSTIAKMKMIKIISDFDISHIELINPTNRISPLLDIIFFGPPSSSQLAFDYLLQLYNNLSFPKSHVGYSFPISVSVISPSAVRVEETTSVTFQFHIGLICNRKVRFPAKFITLVYGDNKSHQSTFKCESNEPNLIEDGSKISMNCKLTKRGAVYPNYFTFGGGNIIVKAFVNGPLLHIRSKTAPVFIEIMISGFLLPGERQHALVQMKTRKQIDFLTVRVEGIKFKSPALRLENQKKKITEKFVNIPKGQHKLFIPIIPESSGKMKVTVNALVGSDASQTSKEVEYKVFDFIDAKILYRPATKVAQVSICLNKMKISSDNDFTLVNMEIIDENGKEVKCKSIGVPTKVRQTMTKALFILDGDENQVPEYGELLVRSGHFEPFRMRLNFEIVEECQPGKSEFNCVTTPLTPILPVNFNLL